jgi:hypothetical protein
MSNTPQRLKHYAAFMQSTKWREIRTRKIAAAGGICEYEDDDEGVDKHHMPSRCTATDSLHVHHLSYANFGGQERDADLEVLCAEHHAIAELMKQECGRCQDSVFDWAEEAEAIWALVCDDSPDWSDCLQSARDMSPAYCQYCDHMMNKDD